MVNVDFYSAIITKVSNALNTLVSGVYTYCHIHASTSMRVCNCLLVCLILLSLHDSVFVTNKYIHFSVNTLR